jgi:hypothetical protein
MLVAGSIVAYQSNGGLGGPYANRWGTRDPAFSGGGSDQAARERKTMIRSELVQMLADDNPGLSIKEIDRIVTIFFDEISQRLADG